MKSMKHAGLVAAALALATAPALWADARPNPYVSIIERNPFGIKPTPTPPAPAEPAAPAPEKDSLNALGRAERDALLRELELERGNLSHVARKLGVSRNTLYRKMHRLGIELPIKKPLH